MSKWADVDWTRRNADIARELGVSRERVRQVRGKLKEPKVIEPTAMNKARGLDISRFTAAELGAELGCTAGWARQIAQELGVPLRRDEYRPWNSRYDWSKVDWRMRNKDIAKVVGASQQVVAARRMRLRSRGLDVPPSRGI